MALEMQHPIGRMSIRTPECLGFTRGKAVACIFCHHVKDIRLVVHGDDFTVLGHEKELDWLCQKMRGRYDIKISRMRLNGGDDDAIRILNRVVSWNDDGDNN